MHIFVYTASVIALWGIIVLSAFGIYGCGTGGKEDDTSSTSSASTEVNQCGDVTCNIPAEALEEALEAAEEAGDSVLELADAADDLTNTGGLDQQVRIAKVSGGGYLKAFVCGCNNTVVENDNDSVVVSDDDVNTSVSAGAQE